MLNSDNQPLDSPSAGGSNSKLHKAKETKNDEFYTQYTDIQQEIEKYLEYAPNTFRGKTVLLPCDDPEWSNFTKYFAEKFEELGLKKLISTSMPLRARTSRGTQNLPNGKRIAHCLIGR